MSYFKLYTSMFENKTHVAKMTDLQKVLLMQVLHKMNKMEAAASKEENPKPNVYKFSHFWMAAALSSHRTKISKALKALEGFGCFDYKSGYKVQAKIKSDNKKGSKAKKELSKISGVREEEYFVPIDHDTFELLLYKYLKQKEIKHRHIVTYALCKYIEQWKGGSVSVNEFGHMLGMASEEIKYTRIKKPLEDLQQMKLISFDKKHGKIEGLKAHALPVKLSTLNKLRYDIKEEAEILKYKEYGISNPETAAAVEDMKIPATLDEVFENISDMYAKRTDKTIRINAGQKTMFRNLKFTAAQMHPYIQKFFKDRSDLQLIKDDAMTFNIIINQLRAVYAQKFCVKENNAS